MPEIYLYDSNQGQAGYKNVPDGTTIGDFFKTQHPGADPAGFTFAANNAEVKGDVALGAGDVVAFTPFKVEGA